MAAGKHLSAHYVLSPIGKLLAVAKGPRLFLLEFSDSKEDQKIIQKLKKTYKADIVFERSLIMRRLEKELAEYFAGKRRKFTVPLAPAGTSFQQKSWKFLQKIGYGQLKSYQEQAVGVGNKKAVRAVAGANGKNKIVIVIPCHRVIGSDGTLTGYSCGLWRKEYLLKLEGAIA